MSKGNVLIMGNSGVGKSTLVNAVLGEEKAVTSFGTEGMTKGIKIYESENPEVPFRLIDTQGFEPAKFPHFEPETVRMVKKWSKEQAKDGNPDTDVSMIWFCIDGTAAKLFPDTVKNLLGAVKIWKGTPIIAVITKSYSKPDRVKNIAMINEAFEKASKTVRPAAIIPVVADAYYLDDVNFAPPEGITDLITKTNELLPEGIRAAASAVADYTLNRKRFLAKGVVSGATAAAAAIGAAPLPLADAAVLGPLEVGLINGIAKIYGIGGKKEQLELLKNTILEVGTVSTAAKSLVSMIKAIPGIGLGASVVNAVVSGTIVAALGIGSINVFEQIYLGQKSLDDIDWVKKALESELGQTLIEKVMAAIQNLTNSSSAGEIATVIIDAILGNKKQ